MPVRCLVCGKPTAATHLGMDACRACTVFYRRNSALGRKLPCASGNRNCWSAQDFIKSCRKCRLERFETFMKAASGEGKPLNSREICTTKQQQLNSQTTEENALISRIRLNYVKLSIFRRTAELGLRGIFRNTRETNVLGKDLFPSTYQQMNEGKKIQIDALFKFMPAMFPEFNELHHSEKWMLIRNYHRCFHCLDSTLRSRRIFGIDAHNYFLASYTSYISLSSIGDFFSDSPDRQQATAATEFLYKTFNRMVSLTRAQLHHVDPTDDEFMALLGLAFWSLEHFEPSDELMNLADRYRTAIMAELAAHYRETIGEERGAIRIGLLLCMLQEYKRAEMALQSDYEVYRMLGTFDDNTLTYRLRAN